MRAIVKQAAEYGLTVYGIENFSPADGHDVLLVRENPERDSQIERLKGIIRSAGRAGIKSFGYNFSIARRGNTRKNTGRGAARKAPGFDAEAFGSGCTHTQRPGMEA